MKDGEIQGSGGTYRDRREQEAENIKFRTSQFESFLAEWTWGEVGVAQGYAFGVGGLFGFQVQFTIKR